METFSATGAVQAGWERFKQRPWFFVGVTVIIGVISGISGQLTGHFDPSGPQAAALFGVMLVGTAIGMVVGLLVKMGTISLYLKAYDNVGSAKFEDLWAPRHIVSFVLASIVVGIIIFLGFILLIVPGIIWALRYAFVQYLVIDRGLDVSAALKESARITSGHKWQLLGFFLLLVLVNILGAICLIVGLLISVPVSALATVHAYRTLSRMAPAA